MPRTLDSRGSAPTGPRVLVIDDDDDIADVLREALSDDGYAVATVRHGAAALDILHHRPADVILLDLRMPIMDGWSFVRSYRDAAADGAAPIILLSGVSNLADVARAVRADAYIAKPFELAAVRQTIERCRVSPKLDA